MFAIILRYSSIVSMDIGCPFLFFIFKDNRAMRMYLLGQH